MNFIHRLKQNLLALYTSDDLKGSFFARLDQYPARFLELYKANSGMADLTTLMRCLIEDVSVKNVFSSSMPPTFVVSIFHTVFVKLPSWSAVQTHNSAHSFFCVGWLFLSSDLCNHCHEWRLTTRPHFLPLSKLKPKYPRCIWAVSHDIKTFLSHQVAKGYFDFFVWPMSYLLMWRWLGLWLLSHTRCRRI